MIISSLWVEDYKNIQHQTFDFDPRFDYTFEIGESVTELLLKKKSLSLIFFQKISM